MLTAILDTEITNHTDLIWRPYGQGEDLKEIDNNVYLKEPNFKLL